jgi:hypothetical protein
MQSLRLLHELNSSSNNHITKNNSTTTNGTENYRSLHGAIRHCFIDGEEEGKIQWNLNIKF